MRLASSLSMKRALISLLHFMVICDCPWMAQSLAQDRAPTTQESGTRVTLQVEQVDPPSWWANSTLSPIRLLLRGTGFTPGTHMESTSEHLKAYNFRCSDNGHYFFAD